MVSSHRQLSSAITPWLVSPRQTLLIRTTEQKFTHSRECLRRLSSARCSSNSRHSDSARTSSALGSSARMLLLQWTPHSSADSSSGQTTAVRACDEFGEWIVHSCAEKNYSRAWLIPRTGIYTVAHDWFHAHGFTQVESSSLSEGCVFVHAHLTNSTHRVLHSRSTELWYQVKDKTKREMEQSTQGLLTLKNGENQFNCQMKSEYNK